MLSRPLHEWLDELLSFQQESVSGPDRHDLLATVTHAAQRDFRWGSDLAHALADRRHWNTDLWTSLIHAWRKGQLTDEQVGQVFRHLGEHELSPTQATRIAALLLTWLENANAPIARDLLSQANDIAARLWISIDPGPRPDPSDSWHSLAIGRPAGILVRYWLTQRSLLRDQPDAVPQSFLADVRAALSTIVQDSTNAGRQARAVSAGQLAFLVDTEERWSQDNLIPRFSRNAGSDDYHAIWDGFLTTGRLTLAVGTLLKDAFLQAPPHILTRTCSARLLDGFVNRYTQMLAHFADDPVEAWVSEFFRHANKAARYRFTFEIHQHLRHSDDSQQREAWARWLERYWKHRLEGVPKPLDDAEVRSTFAWLPAFQTLFPATVGLALRMPSVSLSGSQTIYDLWRGDHGRDAPEAVAKLLIHLGEHASPDPAWHRSAELINVILSVGLPDNLHKQLLEILARL